MALRYESPVKRIGASTPSQLSAKTRRAEEAAGRARRRFLIARTVGSMEGTLSQKREFIEAAMKAGLIPWGALPSKETIRILQARWTAGEQSEEAYLDECRSGRPIILLPREIERRIQLVIDSGIDLTPKALADDFRSQLAAEGIDSPSEYLIRKRFAQARLRRSAARHGSRAAEIDALPHSVLPTRATHDTWALDELTVPVYHRQYDWTLGRWVSAVADAVLVRDVRSGVTLSLHVADSSRRLDEKGAPMRAGFDRDDVLAALLSAACPELASEATREFAGFLPRRLRWDNHVAHKSLAEWITTQTTLEIDIRRIPKRRAINNGAAERTVQMLKHWCAGLVGHVDAYVVTDRVSNDAAADPDGERTRVAGGTSDRVSRRVPIAPENLMTLEELQQELNRIVKKYNYFHIHSMHDRTHATLYHMHLDPRAPRRGRDLVRALVPRTTLVETGGILHYQNGKRYRFSSVVQNMLILLDAEVTYYADPLVRGAWALIRNQLHFLERLEKWAVTAGPQVVARNHRAAARSASDEAASARHYIFTQALGTEALENAEHAHEAAVQRLAAERSGVTELPPLYVPPSAPPAPERSDKPGPTRSRGDVPPTGGDDALTTGDDPPPSASQRPVRLDPWNATDPSDFIQPRQHKGDSSAPADTNSNHSTPDEAGQSDDETSE